MNICLLDDYAKALLRLKSAEETSNMESEEDCPRKRTKRTLNYQRETDTDMGKIVDIDICLLKLSIMAIIFLTNYHVPC